VSGLNTVGATNLLAAVAATGLLLATNFSFANFYENFVAAISVRLVDLRRIPERLRLWHLARRERRTEWRALKLQAKAGGETAVDDAKGQATTEIRSNTVELDQAFASFTGATTAPPEAMSAAAGAATGPTKRGGWSTRGKTEVAESAVIQDMVREAAVK